jgi:hypothetical protein
MTAATGDRIVPGKPGFIKQLAAQFKSILAYRVIVEMINRFRKVHWFLKSPEFIHDLFAAGDQQQEADREKEVSLIHKTGLILCMIMKENAGIVIGDIYAVITEHYRGICSDAQVCYTIKNLQHIRHQMYIGCSACTRLRNA